MAANALGMLQVPLLHQHRNSARHMLGTCPKTRAQGSRGLEENGHQIWSQVPEFASCNHGTRTGKTAQVRLFCSNNSATVCFRQIWSGGNSVAGSLRPSLVSSWYPCRTLKNWDPILCDSRETVKSRPNDCMYEMLLYLHAKCPQH